MTAATAMAGMERRSGVALWRQIADRIRYETAAGALGADGRLPTEMALAERFGVNRHTVRTAIAALVREGVLRAEQGRGTFLERREKLTYPIGPRTRFRDGLSSQASELGSRLLDHALEPADERIAKALELAPGSMVLRLETLSAADGRPLSRATSWLDATRFAGFEKALARTGSVTLAFRDYDVSDYLRRSTVVSARHASDADLGDLGLSPGAIVLVTLAVNVDTDGQAIQFSETRFVADRVELSIAGADSLPG